MAEYLKTREFSDEEFKAIIERSKYLIRRGYFTGINFLQADLNLPQTIIIVHYLHDSQEQIKVVKKVVPNPCIIAPRLTYYLLKQNYFQKPNFREEYEHSTFLDNNFIEISINEAIRNPHDVAVCNKELDLVVPVYNPRTLTNIITKIVEADRAGPMRWIDPVIIVRTNISLTNLEGFVDKYFVSLSRGSEEFYAILNDKRKMKALESYLDKLCETTKIGEIIRSDIVFSSSKVNKDFAYYLESLEEKLAEKQ